MLNDLIGIGGGILMGIAKSMQTYELLILGRFIIGVNCGEMTFPMLLSHCKVVIIMSSCGANYANFLLSLLHSDCLIFMLELVRR